MEETLNSKTSGKSNTVLWLVSMAGVATISFLAGMFIFRSIGYDEGVRFAVTSGSKQGYALGFEMGYQMRDSLAKKEKELSASNQFNLNLIEQEAENPHANIALSGRVDFKEISGRAAAKIVVVIINSTAQFVRYKEMTIHVKYLDKRNNLLKEQDIKLEDILYPGRTVTYEISHKEVPEFTESVEVKLVKATGVD